jgi:hypothetical protein
MKELPKHIRRDIYKEFLFKDFIYLFRTHFKMIKEREKERDASVASV